MDKFDVCINRQRNIDKIVKRIGNEDIIQKNLLVKDKIINKSHYVVMLGETSSGKSTLINSIFEKKVLVESVKPTTGIITEIVANNDSEESLLAINNDETVNSLDIETFNSLSVKPSKKIKRLKYTGRCKNSKYNAMRLFDTPGYGSLVDYHEEILKEFIPESDFIVYVVSYRVGIGDDDFQFLKYISEIINDNIEIVLAVNMCPKDINYDNKRIGEIQLNVNKCLNKDIKTFLIESKSDKKPNAEELWDYIYERINSEQKKEEFLAILKDYQDYILGECKIKVNSKIANIESKKEDIQQKKNIAIDLLDTKQDILDIIERGFTKTKVKGVKAIDKSAMIIKKSITDYIYDESKWSKKEETFTLMEHYYVPKLVNEETDNLVTYIEDEIKLLNNSVEELVHKTLRSLEDNVEINIPSYAEVVNNIVKKYSGDIMQQAVGEIFRKVEKNGNIQANADVINFKKISEISENNASSHNYYNLKNLFKAIKATSIKAITQYLEIFKDSIFYIYDSLNWQKKINEISLEAVNNWANDMEYSMKKYIEQLKNSNIKEIKCLLDELIGEFHKEEKVFEEDNLNELVRLKSEIEFMLDKIMLISLNKSQEKK